MTFFMVDVESDGPIPGKYSMISFAAVIVEPSLERTFVGRLHPISDNWDPKALAISGVSREEAEGFEDPQIVMTRFGQWVKDQSVGQAVFVSDNNGFDWQFVNWYFHFFIGYNPFGFSSMNLGSLYKGVVRSSFESFKHLRRTVHSHDPLDDAMGNAQAMLSIIDEYNVKFKL